MSHALLQVPQWEPSVARSRQRPEQRARPGAVQMGGGKGVVVLGEEVVVEGMVGDGLVVVFGLGELGEEEVLLVAVEDIERLALGLEDVELLMPDKVELLRLDGVELLRLDVAELPLGDIGVLTDAIELEVDEMVELMPLEVGLVLLIELTDAETVLLSPELLADEVVLRLL